MDEDKQQQLFQKFCTETKEKYGENYFDTTTFQVGILKKNI